MTSASPTSGPIGDKREDAKESLESGPGAIGIVEGLAEGGEGLVIRVPTGDTPESALEALRAASREWPFLRMFVADVEMVMAKSDLDIASRYAQLAGDVGERLFPVLQAGHAETVGAILEVTESKELLDRDPTLQRAIRLRNPYVDPMSFVQVDLLRRWREGGREDEALERVLVQTVRGIARGLRNTG